jgi:hypothetical protein
MMDQEQPDNVETVTETESELVTDIKEQITALTDFSTPALQIDYILLNEETVLESEYDQAEKEELVTEEQTWEKEIDPQRIKKLGLTYKFVQKELGIPEGLFETILETMIRYKLPYHKKKIVKKR